MEEPIATYTESRAELRRDFELFPDRVRIFGKGVGVGRFDAVLPLAILNPEPSHHWLRGRFFRYGVIILIAVGCWTAAAGLASRGLAFENVWMTAGYGAIAWVGLMLAVLNVRPVEFVQFFTDAGTIVLDVGRVGPRAAEFDEFVNRLIQQIRASRPKT